MQIVYKYREFKQIKANPLEISKGFANIVYLERLNSSVRTYLKFHSP